MKNHKMLNKTSIHFILISGIFFVLDLFSMSIFHQRFIAWTRMGYIASLVQRCSLYAVLFTSWCAALIAHIIHGTSTKEFAAQYIIGSLGTLLLSKTVSTAYARKLVALILLTLYCTIMLCITIPLNCGVKPSTMMQIIANVITMYGIISFVIR